MPLLNVLMKKIEKNKKHILTDLGRKIGEYILNQSPKSGWILNKLILIYYNIVYILIKLLYYIIY